MLSQKFSFLRFRVLYENYLPQNLEPYGIYYWPDGWYLYDMPKVAVSLDYHGERESSMNCFKRLWSG